MKNTLKWRLGKLPTSDEVRELVKADLITKEEAREIMFNEETEETVEVENLKAEIKFLRETVEKLADKQTIRTVVQEIIPRYISYPIYYPYYYWSGGAGSITYCGGAGTTSASAAYSSTAGSNWVTTGNSEGSQYASTSSFTEIQTF